jgi:hypothetical protein
MRADLTCPLAISRRTKTLCGQSFPHHEEFIFRWKLTLKLDHISQALQLTYALTSILDPLVGAAQSVLLPASSTTAPAMLVATMPRSRPRRLTATAMRPMATVTTTTTEETTMFELGGFYQTAF